jgi:hypothetical protein
MLKRFILCLLIVVFIGISTPVWASELTPQDQLRFQQTDPRYKYIGYSGKDTFIFFDTKTIKLTYNKELNDQVIDVWIYELYTMKGKYTYIKDLIINGSSKEQAENFDKLDHALYHELFYQNKIYVLTAVYYSIDTLIPSNDVHGWMDVIPGSTGEGIVNAVKEYIETQEKPGKNDYPENNLYPVLKI